MSSLIIPLNKVNGLSGCVLAYGHFSTIHPGHIRYLRHAKDQGKQLVVALIGDGKEINPPRYQFTQSERADALALIDMADYVVLLQDNELLDAINILQPTVFVLGKEFEGIVEEPIYSAVDFLRKKGCSIQFYAGDIHYATTDLLSRTTQDLVDQRREQFKQACSRQKLSLNELLNSMQTWKDTSLLIVGDTIVDQYAACEAVGMSAEAPVVVVRELEHKNFIGGAGVVASHIKSLGAKCELISVVGNDSTANLVRKELLSRGIGDGLVVDSSRPTTFKKRYVVENQKLFRVSRLEDHSLDSEVEMQLIKRLEEVAPKAKGIVVSDFVYGVVTDRILEVIERLSSRYGLMLFGDLQCSTQVGAVTRFKNFSVLCPNEREARMALQDKDSGLELLSKKLLLSTFAERLVMKLGAEGFIAYDRNNAGDICSQPFPALSVNPLDVTGAGDSLLAVIATGMASGQSMMATSALACCMASLAVETMGNTPISANSLKHNLKEVLRSE